MARFETAVVPEEGRLVATDGIRGHRYFIDAQGTVTAREVRLIDNLGYLRFRGGSRYGDPRLIEPGAQPQQEAGMLVRPMGRERFRLVSSVLSKRRAAPLGGLVVDGRTGALIEETVGLQSGPGELFGYVRIYHQRHIDRSLAARLLDRSGNVESGVELRARLTAGGFLSVRSHPSGTVLFTRLALGTALSVGANAEPPPLMPTPSMLRITVPLRRNGDTETLCLGAPGHGPGLQLMAVSPLPTRPVIVRCPARFVRHADGVTIWLQEPDAPFGMRTEHRYNLNGQAVRRQWPLGYRGADDALASLSVVARAAEGVGVQWELIGPYESRRAYSLGPVEDWLVRHHPDWFTLTDNRDGGRHTYDDLGVLLYRDLPFDAQYVVRILDGQAVRGRSAMGTDPFVVLLPREVDPDPQREPPHWFDASYGAMPDVRAEWVDHHRVALIPEPASIWALSFAEIMVNVRSGRIVREVRPTLSRDERLRSRYWDLDYANNAVRVLDTNGQATEHGAFTLVTAGPCVRDVLVIDSHGDVVYDRTRWATRTGTSLLSESEAQSEARFQALVTPQLRRFAARFEKMAEEQARHLWSTASQIIAWHNPFPLLMDEEGTALLERAPQQYWATMRVAQALHQHQNEDVITQREHASYIAKALAEVRAVDRRREAPWSDDQQLSDQPSSSSGAAPEAETSQTVTGDRPPPSDAPQQSSPADPDQESAGQ
jgi:hypothetical protein